MFIGGLGMFLIGMHDMSNGIQKSTGQKLQELLGILTNNRFMAIVVGALITAIIQSSGATTVMVVGFVNAGIMTLTQAVGVIMGANIGTCITSWIVSLGQLGDAFAAISPGLYAPLMVGIGAFLIMFSKKIKRQTVGEIIVGLGLLFIGLDFMKNSASDYTQLPIFVKAFEVLGGNPILGIGIGAIVTAVMQSSSASVGILQTLAATGGVVTTSAAVYISLGSNIGSCVTALLSSLGAPRNAKRAAVIHLSFNVLGAVIFGFVCFLVFQFNTVLANGSIGSVGISIFHTIFNIICTTLMFPFAGKLVQLSGFLVKEREEQTEESEEIIALRHLDERILETPSFAVENAILEVLHMGEITEENYKRVCQAVISYDEGVVNAIFATEKTINTLEKMITEYLVKISNLSLSEEQHMVINNLFYSVSDIERIGDHTENIAELLVPKEGQPAIHFSDEAQVELKEIMEYVDRSFVNALLARKDHDIDAASMTAKYEDMVDGLEEELREKHIERLSKQLCNASNGVVFLDIISNLERISDHAYNLAGYVMSEED